MADQLRQRPRARPAPQVSNPAAAVGAASGGNADLQARLGLTRPQARPAPTPYVDMSRSQKADHLVGLQGQSADLLRENGVSQHMATKMGAIMTNEGGRNLRRAHQASQFQGHVDLLRQRLGDRDLQALQADPQALADFSKGLTEEQRHLLGDAFSGQIDLAAVGSDDPATREAALEKVTDSGIRLRANQYQEMNDLRARKSGGEQLSRDESRRLTQLEGFGYTKTGFAGKMGDVGGMSKERFSEIYDEGQQRFEPNQYKALVRSYEKNKKRRDAGDDPTAGFQMSAGIGTFDVNADMESQLADDYDLVADMATSYGTSQIMGAYAQQGLLTAKGADGVDDAVSLAELKASGDRLTPTAADVHQQIAFMNMKGVNLGSTNMTDDRLTRTYNGSQPGSDLYRHYMSGLSNGTAAMNSARRRAGS